MAMRETFRATMADLLAVDERVVILLGDIGVWGFRNEMSLFPERVLNFGILEQTMISFAAGLSASGFLPVVHSIAPFLIERPLEQIKVDFGYQELAGNLVSVGGSYDYSALGGTHHAAGDVDALLSVPKVQIFLPGHSKELEVQLRKNYSNSALSYFRLSEHPNKSAVEMEPESARPLKRGSKGTVACFGPVLDIVIEAVGNEDVTIVYANELSLKAISEVAKIARDSSLVVVEPFFQGTTAQLFLNELGEAKSKIAFEGIPREFSHSYGSFSDQMDRAGFAPDALRGRILRHFP